uniref:Uncharacterized protein n=1 Tax=Trachysalambria curvirostris majanivirus TaxID=2984281 RepID=A0A9C7EYZ1_9VIRU|nr:MAG: hypothetical protein [Trachysalambria curvirostris majanivirus]
MPRWKHTKDRQSYHPRYNNAKKNDDTNYDGNRKQKTYNDQLCSQYQEFCILNNHSYPLHLNISFCNHYPTFYTSYTNYSISNDSVMNDNIGVNRKAIDKSIYAATTIIDNSNNNNNADKKSNNDLTPNQIGGIILDKKNENLSDCKKPTTMDIMLQPITWKRQKDI